MLSPSLRYIRVAGCDGVWIERRKVVIVHDGVDHHRKLNFAESENGAKTKGY